MMCNELAISLSPTSKIRLLDECNKENKLALVRKIKTCSYCNIVGDNLDIRVQPRIQSSHHKVQDCHYFGILVFFSKMAQQIASMITIPPVIESDKIDITSCVLNAEEQVQLLSGSYKILLGRLMVKNFPKFHWLNSIIPKHITHTHSATAAMKTEVFQLPLLLKNEAKCEDCVDILNETTGTMNGLFRDAHGNIKRMTHALCVCYGVVHTEINRQT